ncbi:hypothetical protein [Altererythrobacter aquiaggeris]|uniref:hypothetical protein n=1 Tax=Aestuarierythrobacter aquiaggeris TaxID=1898396 RepID=UPI00301B3076
MLSILLAPALAFATPAQIGPNPSAATDITNPPELEELRRRQRENAPAPVPRTINRTFAECTELAKTNPAQAEITANEWLVRAEGNLKASANHCRGLALAGLGRLEEAAAAFVSGRENAMPDARLYRARLGMLAANALIGAGAPDDALAAIAIAEADARQAGTTRFDGELALDRGRALVALKREVDAAPYFATARAQLPNNADAWLMSATLSRRMDDLTAAQNQIERAAILAPDDPAIGLEAGLIAVLSGREDAARKSWESVIIAAPASTAAETATSYLAQLNEPNP